MSWKKIVEMRKANDAATLSVSSTLQPAQALALISAIIANNAFMGEVTTVKTKKLKTPMPVLNISSKNLTRVAEGTDANGTTPVVAQSANEGKMLDLANVDLFYDLLYSVVDDNLDNPGFANTLAQNVADAFGNDLLDLATNGISDTYVKAYNENSNPVPMYTLAKGWVFLLKESALSNKVDSHSDTDLLVTMTKMLKALPDMYKNPTKIKWIMGSADYENYLALIGAKDSTAAILQDGQSRGYMGYKIAVNPFLAEGTLMLGDPKNLVVAMNTTEAKKAIEEKPRKKVFEYTYTMPVDFEVAVDRAFVIAYDATTEGWENSSGWYE